MLATVGLGRFGGFRAGGRFRSCGFGLLVVWAWVWFRCTECVNRGAFRVELGLVGQGASR